MQKIIEVPRHRGGLHSPFDRQHPRLIFSLLRGILLLALIPTMAYYRPKNNLVVTTIVFTPFVAVALALAARASDQEVLAAMAAYLTRQS